MVLSHILQSSEIQHEDVQLRTVLPYGQKNQLRRASKTKRQDKGQDIDPYSQGIFAHCKYVQSSGWCIYPREFGEVLADAAEKCGGKYNMLTSEDQANIKQHLSKYQAHLPLKGGDPKCAQGIVIPWYQESNKWITGQH